MMHMHGGMRDGMGGHQGRRKRGGFGHGKVLGTTTVGERGQIVIPAEAREALDIEAGDKFVVFAGHGGSLSLVNAEVISKYADMFMSRSEKFEEMANDIMDKINSDDDDADATASDNETPASEDAAPAEETN